MNVEYVAQPNGYGCAIACCAMILGKSYHDMEDWFLNRGFPRERMERGLYDACFHEAIARHGFAYVQMYHFDPTAQRKREEWPPQPFAPIHIAQVDVAAGSHAVVMLGDGAVLDPFKRERASLLHPDYRGVDFVTGFYPRCA